MLHNRRTVDRLAKKRFSAYTTKAHAERAPVLVNLLIIVTAASFTSSTLPSAKSTFFVEGYKAQTLSEAPLGLSVTSCEWRIFSSRKQTCFSVSTHQPPFSQSQNEQRQNTMVQPPKTLMIVDAGNLPMSGAEVWQHRLILKVFCDDSVRCLSCFGGDTCICSHGCDVMLGINMETHCACFLVVLPLRSILLGVSETTS